MEYALANKNRIEECSESLDKVFVEKKQGTLLSLSIATTQIKNAQVFITSDEVNKLFLPEQNRFHEKSGYLEKNYSILVFIKRVALLKAHKTNIKEPEKSDRITSNQAVNLLLGFSMKMDKEYPEHNDFVKKVIDPFIKTNFFSFYSQKGGSTYENIKNKEFNKDEVTKKLLYKYGNIYDEWLNKQEEIEAFNNSAFYSQDRISTMEFLKWAALKGFIKEIEESKDHQETGNKGERNYPEWLALELHKQLTEQGLISGDFNSMWQWLPKHKNTLPFLADRLSKCFEEECPLNRKQPNLTAYIKYSGTSFRQVTATTDRTMISKIDTVIQNLQAYKAKIKT